MPETVEVRVGEPSQGWAEVTLRAGRQELVIEASYVYDGFSALAASLFKLLNYRHLAPEDTLVTWLSEPAEYDLRFTRDGDTYRVTVDYYPDSRRGAGTPPSYHVFDAVGTYKQVCLPFIHAVQRLGERYSAAEWGERWQREFPIRWMELLTAEALRQAGEGTT